MLDNLSNKIDSYPFIDTKGYTDISYSIKDCRFFIVSLINLQPRIFLRKILNGNCIFSCVIGDKTTLIICKNTLLILSSSLDVSVINSFIQFNKVPTDVDNIDLLIIPDCIIKLPGGVHLNICYNLKPVFDPSTRDTLKYNVTLVTLSCIQLNDGYNTRIQYSLSNGLRFSVGLGFGKGRTKYFKEWLLFYNIAQPLTLILKSFEGVISINGITSNVTIHTGLSIYSLHSINRLDAINIRGLLYLKDVYNVRILIKTLLV